MSCGNCSGNCSKKLPINKPPRFPLFLLKMSKERFLASLHNAGILIGTHPGVIELGNEKKYNVLQSNLTFRDITEDEKEEIMDIAKELSNQ